MDSRQNFPTVREHAMLQPAVSRGRSVPDVLQVLSSLEASRLRESRSHVPAELQASHFPSEAKVQRGSLSPVSAAAQILATMKQKQRIGCQSNSVIFRQGDPADSVYYVQRGRIKLSRVSGSGR